MLRLNFIVVDRTRSSFIREGEEEYLKRLKRFVGYRWTEVKPVKISKNTLDEEIIKKEGENILAKVEAGDYMIALDRTGKQCSSEYFAAMFKKLSVENKGQVCFVIGGPLGLSKDVLYRADHIMSISEMTLTHEMVRLILTEQIYRAFTIIEGHKYHK
ncbi:MAG: 23S rRNA (pseudouridine(1915)-N(3))-methyltransferase RlmH [Deltaproteobacteria bacterium]|nr:23S rRNA (pseudouridine(1915)-N(3))-methyltransferase RlmH [Deltaproteobacteria bacterium]